MKAEIAEELSRVFNVVTTVVNVQESIDKSIAFHGMDLFNHLIELFDPRTRLEWKFSTCDSFNPLTYDFLMDFISKWILGLNAAKPRSVTKSRTTSGSAKSHFVKHASDFEMSHLQG